MQTRKLSASILASLPPHLPIQPLGNPLKNQIHSRKPLTQATFKRNIAISAIAFLSLSSVLSSNPNEINLQGGGHKIQHKMY
ncbi:hypothetical protein [Helicobacter macacae]|uniref:Uncharacterized protein n=1 Tax=Helicobacter macacae MIT 99-5501 TaxID=1357400 RepID=V8CBJ8_9HELI|nr:hypothetical protein [Helicobacter macacae]ETD24096.1 hypothetical protein HMPREF2086_00843 [Helicobacter macacae MIT 99-5501]